MNRIVIEVIPHENQRYPTVGDWQFVGSELRISVSAVADWRSQALVAIHEMAEAILCLAHGIPQELVDEFDMGHPELDDPGGDPRCPYRLQHEVALGIESTLADMLPYSWELHQQLLDSLNGKAREEA